MKKLSIFFSMLLLMAIGFSSCNDEKSQPPIIIPEGGLGNGNWNDPFTATQILNGSQGKEKWVTGYIVGWIDTKGGTNNTMSEETCTFTTPATLSSNILLAASPDEKDFNNCIPVQLSNDVRSALNLQDNPGNLGKQVTLKANVERYFGKNEALKSVTAYNWGDKGLKEDDPDPDKPGDGTGNGSMDTPYSVAQLLGGASGSNVWATGYIVGYITSSSSGASSLTAESAKFTATDAVASNLMIADSPNETDYTKCTSVQLTSGSAVRAALNLLDHPENLGKQVSVLGNIAKYFGVNGMKELSAYNWGPKGSTGGGTSSESSIYTGLVNDCTGWTFDNINKPESLNDIWSWKVYNNSGYLNASAYAGGAYASEAYAISPEISLEGYKSASVTFDHTAKFQTTLRELCGIAIRESGATSWTMLTMPTWPDAGAWTFVNAGNIDLTAYAGKKVQIAFKYGSTTSGADTWEIKNFKVTGTK